MGPASLGPEHNCWGQKRERLTIPAVACLLGSSINHEQPKTFLDSMALAGQEMISCPECPPVSVGPCFPAGAERSHAGLSHQQRMVPTAGNPVEALAGDREGASEALFCLVPKLGGWGEKSCRLKSNHISDIFQLCIVYFSFVNGNYVR